MNNSHAKQKCEVKKLASIQQQCQPHWWNINTCFIIIIKILEELMTCPS